MIVGQWFCTIAVLIIDGLNYKIVVTIVRMKIKFYMFSSSSRFTCL